MTEYINNFLLTQWLWSITGGFWHLSINSIVLFLLFKLWAHLPFIKSLALSLFATIGSFIIFFICFGGLIWGLHVTYVLPEDALQGDYNILHASLILATIYTVLQTTHLAFFIRWIPAGRLWRIFLCIVCANFISAFLVYKINFMEYL